MENNFEWHKPKDKEPRELEPILVYCKFDGKVRKSVHPGRYYIGSYCINGFTSIPDTVYAWRYIDLTPPKFIE